MSSFLFVLSTSAGGAILCGILERNTMRIAFFTDTFPPQTNGVANTVYRFAQALSRAGHTVRVYTISANADLPSDGFEVVRLPSLPALVYPGERVGIPGFTLKSVREFAPDIIHSHTPFGVGLEAARVARILNVPLAGTHHTFFDHYLPHVHLDFAWARRLSWKFTVWYYNKCSVVTSPTRSLEDVLLAHGLSVHTERVFNIVDTEFFRAPSERERAEAKKKYSITGLSVVYMGRLSVEKSIDDAVRAAAAVSARIPHTTLLVVGDGPERRRLEDLAASYPKLKTMFTGALRDRELVEALWAGDVFLTASKSENMPLALLEAMAVALPIAAVGSFGMTEVVQHEKNALLSEANDFVALEEHLHTLLSNAELQKRFSDASLRMATQYSPAQVTERLITLYQKLTKPLY